MNICENPRNIPSQICQPPDLPPPAKGLHIELHILGYPYPTLPLPPLPSPIQCGGTSPLPWSMYATLQHLPPFVETGSERQYAMSCTAPVLLK